MSAPPRTSRPSTPSSSAVQPCEVFLAIWGGVVGFVGWASCFRLVSPVADWLLEGRTGSNLLSGLVRLVVLVFGLVGMLLILRLPMAVGSDGTCGPDSRSAFAVVFLSSLAGLAAFGIVRLIARRSSADR